MLSSLHGERLLAFTIIVLAILVLVWQFIKMGASGAAEVFASVMFIVRMLAREVTDKSAPGHEKLNGLLIVLLFLVLVVLLVMLAMPSLRATVLGESPNQTVIVAALLVALTIPFSGIVCVKACIRHRSEVEIAKQRVVPVREAP